MEELRAFYPYEDYYSEAIEGESSLLTRLDRFYGNKRICDVVISARKGGRLLDVGCGTGIFLDMMRRRGEWEVFGVEINEEAARYARGKLQLDVFAGELGEASFPTAHFDVVTLWHVLEHLHEPRLVLQEIYRILRDDGWLLLSLPNAASYEAQAFGEFWAGLDVPRHLYFFTPTAIRELLRQEGFETVKLRTKSIMGAYRTLTLSLGFVVDEKVASERWKALLNKLINAIPTRLLMAPCLRFLDFINRGSIMTVFARKVVGDKAASSHKQSLRRVDDDRDRA